MYPSRHLEMTRSRTSERAAMATPAIGKRCLFRRAPPSRIKFSESLQGSGWFRPSSEFLSQSDKKPFWAADVAEPIRVFVLNDFAHELGAALAQPLERLVDVVHGEHGAQVAQSVHRSVPVICDDRRRKKPRELESAVAVRCAHHGNLDALIAQSSDTSGPFSFDRGPAFEIEAELAKESNRRVEISDDDSYVVHPFKRHVFTL